MAQFLIGHEIGVGFADDGEVGISGGIYHAAHVRTQHIASLGIFIEDIFGDGIENAMKFVEVYVHNFLPKQSIKRKVLRSFPHEI